MWRQKTWLFLLFSVKGRVRHACLSKQSREQQHRSHYIKSRSVHLWQEKAHDSTNPQIQIVGYANNQRNGFRSADCVWSASVE